MHDLNHDGFAGQAPTIKKIHCVQTIALGPHHRWSANGHNKLKAIGFPI
jgi:hypothetical protein